MLTYRASDDEWVSNCSGGTLFRFNVVAPFSGVLFSDKRYFTGVPSIPPRVYSSRYLKIRGATRKAG